MTDWTLTYADEEGITHATTVQADDLNAARVPALAVLPEGCAFVSLVMVQLKPAPLVASPNGAVWSIAVDDNGNITATPATTESPDPQGVAS